jgi:hypothetical protein
VATNGFASWGGTLATTGNAGAASMFLTRLTVPNTALVSAVLLDVGTGVGSGINIKGLIYDSAHSVLLAQSVNHTSTVTGYNRLELASSVSLPAGNYYVGYVCDVSLSITLTGSGATSWFVGGGQSVASPPNPLTGGASNGGGAGVAVEYDGAAALDYGFGTDFTTGATLSSQSRVATLSGSGRQAARAVIPHPFNTGKYYCEVLFGGTVTAPICGVMAASAPLVGLASTFSYGGYLDSTGTLTTCKGLNGSSTFSLGLTYAAGDIMGILYDTTGAPTLQFNKNNGAFSTAQTLTNNLWPSMVFVSDTSAAAFTLKDYRASQTYALPSGAAAWSASSGPSLGGPRQSLVA